MAKLVKGNKVVDVIDEKVEQFLEDGYDLVNEKGEVIKRATGGRTVSLAEYNKVADELDALKAAKGEQGDSDEIEALKHQINELKEENKVLLEENDKVTKSLRAAQQHNRNNGK